MVGAVSFVFVFGHMVTNATTIKLLVFSEKIRNVGKNYLRGDGLMSKENVLNCTENMDFKLLNCDKNGIQIIILEFI